MTRNRPFFILTVAVLLVVCLLPQQCLATNSQPIPETAELTIHYTDHEPLTGAEFALFCLGEWDDEYALILREPYADYAVDVDLHDTSTWKGAAAAFQGFILRDQVEPEAQGQIDGNGTLTFSSLDRGVYLLVGKPYDLNSKSYESEPVLLMLPAFDGKIWQDAITVNPKWEKKDLPDEEDQTDVRKVLKVWKDIKVESRPKAIEVELLKDGKVYDRVVLSEKNQWSHTWTELPAGHRWMVVEDVPAGYRMKVTREGNAFVVTNREDPDDIPKDETTPNSDPEPEDKPEDKPDGEPSEDEDTLPLTGQPWVIVMGLFAVGLLLVVAGIACRRGGYHES